jgi:hypothetical protein
MSRDQLDERTLEMLNSFFDDPIGLDEPPSSLADAIADARKRASKDAAPAPTTLNPVRWSRSWLAAAGCVGMVVVALGLVGLASEQSPGSEVATTLSALENRGSGDAWVEGVTRSTLMLEVDGLPVPQDAYLELWLLADAGGEPLSLGEAVAGAHRIPDGTDLTDYSTVDVSVERFDGDRSHSGRSVLRGDVLKPDIPS